MTNYDKIMSEMTIEKIIDIIDNPCHYCVLREVNCTDESYAESMCKNGVYVWLKTEVKCD